MAFCDILGILLQFLDHRAAVIANTSDVTRGKLRCIVLLQILRPYFLPAGT